MAKERGDRSVQIRERERESEREAEHRVLVGARAVRGAWGIRVETEEDEGDG